MFFCFVFCYHKVTAAKKDWEVLIGKFLLHENTCQYLLNLHDNYSSSPNGV